MIWLAFSLQIFRQLHVCLCLQDFTKIGRIHFSAPIQYWRVKVTIAVLHLHVVLWQMFRYIIQWGLVFRWDSSIVKLKYSLRFYDSICVSTGSQHEICTVYSVPCYSCYDWDKFTRHKLYPQGDTWRMVPFLMLLPYTTDGENHYRNYHFSSSLMKYSIFVFLFNAPGVK